MKKIILLACVCALITASGCAAKKNKPAEEVQAAPVEETIVETEVEEEDLVNNHTVKKGECLWWIAEYQQVYNDPFMWPLIYKANRDQIKNPDRIFPNQTFVIPRQFTKSELIKARKQAGAANPYLPPQSANIPSTLKNELGWN